MGHRTLHKNRENGGYIALISTIIISLILLGLTVNMSTAGFFVRFSSLDSEYKRVSLGLAESCAQVALLRLAKDFTYKPSSLDRDVIIGADRCTILDIFTPNSADPERKLIKTTAGYKGAFSNMEVEATVQDPSVAPRIPGNIFIVVKVNNNDGGSASAGDFTVDLMATNPSDSSFPGAVTGTLVTVDPGGYSVSETGPAGYTTFYSADCSSTIAAGETKTCTITNNDVPTTATLTVIVNVINDNSGTNVPANFPLFVNGVQLQTASESYFRLAVTP